jgi:hypothetical protein
VAAGLLGEWGLLGGVQRKEILMESSTYRLIRRVSWEEGFKKGQREAMQRVCFSLLRARLEELPPEAARVSAIEDLSLLQQITDRLIAASDPEAVTEVLRSLPGAPSER